MSSSPTPKVESVHFGFVNQELELPCAAVVDALGQNYSALRNEYVVGVVGAGKGQLRAFSQVPLSFWKQ